ncbi:MAG TPA: hypothetical protein VJH96_04575 [Patescibacteria group bacterium]|nr:hypothetical protein [Patescibacteria group bacterium]
MSEGEGENKTESRRDFFEHIGKLGKSKTPASTPEKTLPKDKSPGFFEKVMPRREALKTGGAAIAGAVISDTLLNVIENPSAYANALGELAKSLGKSVASEVTKAGLEKLFEEISERVDTYTMGRKNRDFDFFPEGKRFLIHTEREGFWHTDEKIVSALAAMAMKSVFKGTSVAPLEKVREETREQKELRENEEVNKGTLPEKGSITRESIEVDCNVKVDTSSKNLRMFFEEIFEDLPEEKRPDFALQRLNIERDVATVQGTLTFRDASTQEEVATFVFKGSSISVTRLDADFRKRLKKFGVSVSSSLDTDMLELQALIKAFSNTQTVLTALKKKHEKNARK